MTLAELCERLSTPYQGDSTLELDHVTGFEEVGERGLAFISDPGTLAALPTPGGVFLAQKKSLSHINPETACALIVPEGTVAPGYNLVFSEDPLATHVAASLLLSKQPQKTNQVSKLAHVDPSAKLGKNVTLDPGVVLYPGVVIGDGCVLRANTVLMDNVEVGENCLFYPNVTIREGCQIGNRVILHSGVVIGADGYGYFQREGVNVKIPQVGKVVLEDEVEVGANSCIDRARFTKTLIGRATKLDNLVHIAHNVEVGADSLITAQSGIAGSTKTGSHLMMGGQSGIRDNLILGDHVTLLARTLVTAKAEAGETLAGMPSRPYTKWRHLQAMLSQIEGLLDRLQGIEGFLRTLGFKKKIR